MSKKFGVLMLGAALIAFSPLALAQSASDQQTQQTQSQQAQQPQQTPEQQQRNEIEKQNTAPNPCGDKGYQNVPGC
jgi:hypothetical protein